MTATLEASSHAQIMPEVGIDWPSLIRALIALPVAACGLRYGFVLWNDSRLLLSRPSANPFDFALSQRFHDFYVLAHIMGIVVLVVSLIGIVSAVLSIMSALYRHQSPTTD